MVLIQRLGELDKSFVLLGTFNAVYLFGGGLAGYWVDKKVP